MRKRTEETICLLNKISVCDNESQVDALLDRLAETSSPKVLSFVNAHAINLTSRDGAFYQNLLASDIILRDGSGMATLFRWLGRSAGANLNGTDLIPQIAKKYQGRTVALFGTAEPWLGRAATRLTAMGMKVSQVCDGFQTPSFYCEKLQESPADLVILGMGMPKQEAVAQLLRESMTSPCLIVNGGAILDFLAGRIKRAPRWLQSIGMEWGYRLWNEPRRLFRRYVIGNLTFLYSSLKLAITERSRA